MNGFDPILYAFIAACLRALTALKTIRPPDFDIGIEWIHAIKKLIQEIMFLVPWIAVCWLYVREALKAMGLL